jgi:hypothetical protein
VETSSPNSWAASVIFKKMPKENPPPTPIHRRKIAQSGHPDFVAPRFKKNTFCCRQIKQQSLGIDSNLKLTPAWF